MNKRCIIYLFALFLVVSVTQAGLWDPPIQNESFEFPVLEVGMWSQRIDDWFEESWFGSFIQFEGTDMPVTPYGNQWGGAGGDRVDNAIYQQIGTWDENIDYTISVFMGHRINVEYGILVVSLWAGGNASLALEDTYLSATGATQIASASLDPFAATPPDEIVEVDESVILNTGTGHSQGDPLWVMLQVVGGSQAFYDYIRVEARDIASNPVPSNFAEFVARTPTLSWTAPSNFTPTSYDISYDTDPNCDMTTITGLTNMSYSITEPLDWAAQYYWKVTSYDDSTPHAGQVWTFTVTPEWAVVLVDPVGTTVAEGETAEFTVSGLNIEGYQWMKNGVDMVDGDGVAGTTTGTLSISGVDISDEGTYSCRLINHVDDAVSEGAYLWTERQVGYWRLDGDLVDEIDGRTGTVSTGDPNFAAEGMDGSCYKFYGDEYIEIADSADFYNFYPNGFTVSCWMKPTDGAGWGGLVSKQEQVWPYVGWVLYRSGAFGVATLRGVEDLYGSTSLVNGNWHLVVMNYDADDGVLRVSVDGKTDAMTSVDVDLALTDRPLIIGNDDPIEGTAFFKGLVDEVKIWTYALSLEEIAGLYTEFVPSADFCMEGPAFDFNGDCIVRLNDFADFAASWLDCNYIPESECGI